MSIVVALALILVLPATATAETVLRVGESVTLSADQRVEDDFYAVGGSVAVSGETVGDVYAVGGSVTANGTVGVDLSVLGGSVQIHGPVGDDLRVVGGEVTIADAVAGDVFVIGGSLNVLSSGSVEGDIFFYGGEAQIAGAVGGSVMGAAERFRIDAPVAGDVDVRSSRAVVLGDRATIGGDVRYASSGGLTRASGAVVEGDVLESPSRHSGTDSRFDAAGVLTGLIIHAFALLVLALLIRRRLDGLVRSALAHPSRSAVVGLGVLFVGPVIAILLMVTVLGVLLGAPLLSALIALVIIGYVLAPALIGALMAKLATGVPDCSFLWLLAGVGVTHALLLIPILGAVIVFAASLLMIGVLAYRAYEMIR